MEVTWTLAVLTGGWRRSGVRAVKPAGSSVTRPGWCSACRRNIMEPTSPCTANTAPKTVQTPGGPVTTPYVWPSGGQGRGLRWGGGVNMCADLANVLLIMLMQIFYYFPLTALRDLIRRLELLMQNIGKTCIIQYGWFTLFFFCSGSARWPAAKGFSRGRWSAKPATTPLQSARVKNLKQSSSANWSRVQVRTRLNYITVRVTSRTWPIPVAQQ